ncbi:MAG: SDR family oxidoreductase [Aureispira sp.]|nr:SDR family oxidoreductase [Aureispira sp.]
MAKRNFKNSVIVITGAAGNLGTALCERFGKEGAKFIALDLNPKDVERLAKQLEAKNIEVFARACDITDAEACKAVVEEGKKHFGRIDHLINNAGITHIERYRKMDKSKNTIRKVMEVNFFGSVNSTEACLDDIVWNKGMILTVSSVAGFAPLIGRTAYSASKHALHGFFESLRAELADDGVQCMMICPSFISPNKPKDSEKVDATEKGSIYQPKKLVGKEVTATMAAEDIYNAAIANKPLVTVGKVSKQSYLLTRVAPNLYENIMRKRLKDDE